MEQANPTRAIREEYVEFGPESYYQQHGAEYRNPHEDAIRSTLARCHRAWKFDLTHVLDLACGSGEASLELRAIGAKQITGCDPYTFEAYKARTGDEALTLTFEQIAAGELAERTFSLIVCSYALHLLEPSRLPRLLNQLAQHGNQMLILSPHKRPVIQETWGWRLKGESYHQRVRARLFSAKCTVEEPEDTHG